MRRLRTPVSEGRKDASRFVLSRASSPFKALRSSISLVLDPPQDPSMTQDCLESAHQKTRTSRTEKKRKSP